MYPTTRHAATLLTPGRLSTEDRRPVHPSDVARTERDEARSVPTERDDGDDVRATAGTAAAPPVRGTSRAAATAQDPYGEWVRRAWAAGHPVILIAPGRFRPGNLMPIWSWAMPPNDLLDTAREYARGRVDWVHAVMPGLTELLALHRSVVGPRPTGPRRRRGGPAGVPWRRLVAQQHVGPMAISDTRDGVTVHVLDLPAGWLACPILSVGPPVGSHGVVRDDDPSLPERRPAAG